MNGLTQSHLVGIRAGINYSDIIIKGLSPYSEPMLGLVGGLKYEMILADNNSIGVDILFNQQGLEFISGKYRYDYISVPIKYGYVIGNRIKFTPKVGIQPSLLLNAMYSGATYDEDGNLIGNGILNIYTDSPKFDLAGIAELELGFGIERLEIFTLLSFNYSLPSFSDHYGITLSIGLKYII